MLLCSSFVRSHVTYFFVCVCVRWLLRCTAVDVSLVSRRPQISTDKYTYIEYYDHIESDHAYVYRHLQAHTHTHTHTHTFTLSLTHTLTRTLNHSLTVTHSHPHSLTHSRTQV